MTTTRKTITVTKQQDEWIQGKIATGGFTDDSEYIRDLIRLDQARQGEIEYLRAELLKGELSGEAEPFDFEEFRKKMADTYAKTKR